MVSQPWVYVVALVAAFVVATLASPVGVSGAVLLLPFQVSVLGTPSPAVTPTNLLYNIVATPGALYRYWRQQQTGGSLTRVLLIGTIPGVVAGAIIRVEFLPSPRAFDVVVAAVLIPLGAWILIGRRGTPKKAPRSTPPLRPVALGILAAAIGLCGWHLWHWCVTSIAGVIRFVILAIGHAGAAAHD
jgi:uncharacterized protein